ncbi:NAD-dependent epimerase/dehydratase family protein [Candidatus Lucifugimonas marina]|uniref:NAD-dependent epimerase/dehydratase family protein n=1 Tax=Candidatus Lucifugimonas marina TaxID=3038979 RepID=A0AAJ6CUJ6_9CHLR|nr:NAD-dependent epimerase/dehydratase family protein [SAR202 cluster bacterium JH639]WFG34889.1 NAD-dependent epimerase/dehydratase family protein [SAR202 cluster bacterium JH545]WFG38840.1 NAD-dependent epimerase/dehydratase family protein [SAR202 cluster bacterium JH1073]
MKIVVTGCAGFIGSRVSSLLTENGHEVRGLDNLNDAYDVRMKDWRVENILTPGGIDWVNGDITDRDLVIGLIEDFEPDAVVNLAARAGVRQSIDDPWVYYETNVTGTLNLLEACKDAGVTRFLLASTSSVYGKNQMPFSEDAVIDSLLSPYAASKKAAEDLCRLYNYLFDFDVTIFRFFTVYGPSGRPDMSVFRFIRWIVEGDTLQLNGDGKQQRDFTHVDDVARGVVAAVDRKPGIETINLGSDSPVELNEVIGQIESLTGKTANIENHPFPDTDVMATWANISRARELLDWEPQVELRQGIATAVDWYMANRDWAKDISL